MLSNIRIQYQKLSDDESVKSIWGLTNLYFGSEREDHLLTPGEEILSLNVNGYPLEIKKVPEFQYFNPISI
jgi:hypothetical protein